MGRLASPNKPPLDVAARKAVYDTIAAGGAAGVTWGRLKMWFGSYSLSSLRDRLDRLERDGVIEAFRVRKRADSLANYPGYRAVTEEDDR